MIRNHVEGNFYTDEAYQRQRYYPGVYTTPELWVDGLDEFQGAHETIWLQWDEYRSMIQTRRAVPSPLTMDIQVDYDADAYAGTVHVEVVATSSISVDDLRLRFGIIESGLRLGGDVFNQVLRRYFPDLSGISLAIAQGDTVSHSEDFVMETTWDAESCKIVAFVQDDSTREVLQSIQGPVMLTAPEVAADLTVTLAGENLILEWSPVVQDTNGNPLAVDIYHLYRDTTPFFEAGLLPFDSTATPWYIDHSGVVGDVGARYFYSVTAVGGEKESRFSNVVGECDKAMFPSK